MKLSDIEKKAQSLGIRTTWKFSKREIIRDIQRKEGNFECFGTAKGGCNQLACCWREDCIK